MDDFVVIALFRHGLTEENKRRAYLGWNDSRLCPESHALQAASTYERYFSSDLQRCVHTAELLFPGVNLTRLDHLREMNFGAWEGKTYEELKGNQIYQKWLSDPASYSPPGGESFGQFRTRVKQGWNKMIDEILSADILRCAVITHGGVIKFLLSQFAPEEKEFNLWQVPHGNGFELIFDRDSLRRGERCTLLQEVPLTAKENG